jgi:hypothetical protein
MGSISDVAAHLFELNRVHGLQSAFFTDDDRFLAGVALLPILDHHNLEDALETRRGTGSGNVGASPS